MRTQKTINPTDLTNESILKFHIGRGGRFYNAGYLTFKGIGGFDSNDYDYLYESWENYNDIERELANKPNLLEKLEQCRDNQDFTFFEKIGLNVGDKIWVDQSGAFIISDEDYENCEGRMMFDGDHDTLYTTRIDELSNDEIGAIIRDEPYSEVLDYLMWLNNTDDLDDLYN